MIAMVITTLCHENCCNNNDHLSNTQIPQNTNTERTKLLIIERTEWAKVNQLECSKIFEGKQ